MNKTSFVVVIIIIIIPLFKSFHCAYQECFERYATFLNNNKSLKLTPYIKSGKIEDAQSKALVNLEGFEDVKSYAGYFTVNPEFNSNLFFWYFVAEQEPKNAPVILWLQGGPGVASTIGIFIINGPFEYKSGRLTKRYHSWNKKYHMIYIDNPVGTGYSFTDGGYAKNQTAIGNDLYKALIQFFKLFPDLKNNDFYVTGESYAGKYIPAVSYAIHNNNNNAELKINLKGFAIGNGLTHPIMQFIYGEYLYKIGVANKNEYETLQKFQNTFVEQIKNEQWNEASDSYSYYRQLMLFCLIKTPKYMEERFVHNLLKGSDTHMLYEFYEIIKSPELIESLHSISVSSPSLADSIENVQIHLLDDMVKSMAYEVSELLSHYRAIIFNGQLDLQISYRTTEDYLMNLTFSGCEEFRDNKRRLWMVDGELAGYVKNGGNLTLALVRNAGHMAIADQPKWTMDLIEKLTNNKPF